MTERNNNQQMSLTDFLIRAAIWGSLGYLADLRGSKLRGCAFLGPVSEQVLGFTLEDVAAAMEQERREKERKESMANPGEKLLAIDFSSPQVIRNDRHASTMPPNQLPRYSKWREVIKHPSIVLVLGGRGSGKSATSYRILEDFRYSLSPYVVGFPENNKGLLPDWMGIEQRLEDVPPRSISIVDEAYLSHHAREWRKTGNIDISRLLNLSRQQDKTIVFIAQLGRQLDIDIVSSADVLVLKNPGMLQPRFDRNEFRDILTEAKQAFQSVKGDTRRWSYIYSQNANFAGLLENELPTFWSLQLSKAYANMGETALPKQAKKTTPKEKRQKAWELNQGGWSLSQIKTYFGVSKSTVYNWIHDYPYNRHSKEDG